ncbi:hypothetical protein BOTBODRAFT_173977 [Botryobasidium botryosum FD-172 SS1]|uniref:NACHT domain-containing protein n=1 Tax=Botryobasidium botryosum (strain FD-172 SS1) TaxID=930990 RepID=A0A067MIY2_BOTB1|nr:hypothetical protein BOTBODRAFT_173977 [Botryobasidium botryosum FD-172 SS1]
MHPHADHDSAPVVYLRIERADQDLRPRGHAVARNTQPDGTQLWTAPSIGVALTPVAHGSKDLLAHFDTVLASLEAFVNFVDKLVEVHPYAKAAWSVLTAVYKVAKAQRVRDATLVALFETMAAALEIAHRAEDVSKAKKESALLAQKAYECSLFIHNYARITSFACRALFQLGSGIDSEIARFTKDFQVFRNRLDTSVMLSVSEAVSDIKLELGGLKQRIENSDNNHVLRELKITAGWDATRTCLPNTRTSVLSSIEEWVFEITDQTRDSNQPFFLTGVAGSGKTSIANTLASKFRDLGCLGSTFFFDHAFDDRNNPRMVFCSVARRLAACDADIKRSIIAALEKDPDLPHADIRRQFSALIREPCCSAPMGRPLVLLFDALDECHPRDILLDIIVKEFPRLPARFRVIITARSESSILSALESSAKRDGIKVQTTRQAMAGCEASQELVHLSTGLFIWAKTACDLIDDSLSPEMQLEAVLSKNYHAKDLDRLYTLALDKALMQDCQVRQKSFQLYMGIILAAKMPVSARVIDRLVVQHESVPKITAERFLPALQSLLHGVASPDAPITTLHSSFRDFLTNKSRSKNFYIDKAPRNASLALACFEILNADLKDNICDLPADTTSKSEIAEDVIQRHIDDGLRYAACFGFAHLIESRPEYTHNELIGAVDDFLCNHILHWLEILSLLDQCALAHSLQNVLPWLKRFRPSDVRLYQITLDACRFVQRFTPTIRAAPLQIYSSALLLTPSDTVLRSQYFNEARAPWRLRNGEKRWPSLLAPLAGHSDHVTFVTFSPDNTRLASASEDRTIRIWDGCTGTLIDELNGHTSSVNCVVFSPDGCYIASASSDSIIRIWDGHTHAPLGEPLTGHAGDVPCITFCHAGRHLASASRDGTIRLWDVRTGALVCRPLADHIDEVLAVAASPNGSVIASGSRDCTIRLWDAHTGAPIGEVLIMHTNSITSLIFSPDGNRIASASPDHTVCLWDAGTGAQIAKPFRHSEPVDAIAFLPGTDRLISLSGSCIRELWDEGIHAPITEHKSFPIRGHAHHITSISFSPDGSHLASVGHHGYTIRLWDWHAKPSASTASGKKVALYSHMYSLKGPARN